MSVVTNQTQYEAIFRRHLARSTTDQDVVSGVFPSLDDALARFAEGQSLRIYTGFDPSAPSLHLGNTVALFLLERLRQLGHRPVVLIGDFTAQIGDPTDKTATRQQLSTQQVADNMAQYQQQFEKILPPGSYELRCNSEWLASLNLTDVIDLTSRVTVQQMEARDMFQARREQEKPIFLHEFLYPLLQGYDSVALDVDAEVGGNDQTFNMLMGRQFLNEFKQKDKLVLATRLLVDPVTGKKIGKTEGASLWLNARAEDFYDNFLRSVPDEMIGMVFELCTLEPYEHIDEYIAQAKTDPRRIKDILARDLTARFMGARTIEDLKVIREITLTGDQLELPRAVQECGFGTSLSEAKRLISQGGVRVNNQPVVEWKHRLHVGDVLEVRSQKIKIV